VIIDHDFDRDLVNHWRCCGPGILCQKRSGGWYVSFRGQGFPSPFKTLKAAKEAADKWVMARSEAIQNKGDK
jgi:hypothetical protein